MTRRIASVAQWLTVGILTASACEPALLEQDEVLNEEGVRTAQTARPPTLTKVEPAAIIAGSEGELTITGKGFVPGLRVMVGIRAVALPVSLPSP